MKNRNNDPKVVYREKIEKNYSKVFEYYLDIETSLHWARKTAEAICKYLCVSNRIYFNDSASFKVLTDALYRKRIILPTIKECLDLLRVSGNKGSHVSSVNEHFDIHYLDGTVSRLKSVLSWLRDNYRDITNIDSWEEYFDEDNVANKIQESSDKDEDTKNNKENIETTINSKDKEENRKEKGQALKTYFTEQWEKNTDDDGVMSFKGISIVAENLRQKGPDILGTSSMPDKIEGTIVMSLGILNPEEQMKKEYLRRGTEILVGGGGLFLLISMLIQVLAPPMIAVIVAFFAGGIAGGPLAIFGIAAGLAILTGVVIHALKTKSPKETSDYCFYCISEGINSWISKGSDNSESVKLSKKELKASYVLYIEVAKADGHFDESEKLMIKSLCSESETDMTFHQAIEYLKKAPVIKKKLIIEYCETVAKADKNYDESEKKLIKDISKQLLG